jgi:hypothetical protein
MSLHLQPVQVGTGSHDTESHLVFADGGLIAVLVHLSEAHDEQAGMWFPEAWFGPGHGSNQPPFVSLDKAQDWIEERLAKV